MSSSTSHNLLAGGFGGGLTATLATPFDTIKVRIQTRVYATAAAPYPSLVHVVRSTLRDAGWNGLWRGATHRALSNAPSGAIMFATYEGVPERSRTETVVTSATNGAV